MVIEDRMEEVIEEGTGEGMEEGTEWVTEEVMKDRMEKVTEEVTENICDNGGIFMSQRRYLRKYRRFPAHGTIIFTMGNGNNNDVYPTFLNW